MRAIWTSRIRWTVCSDLFFGIPGPQALCFGHQPHIHEQREQPQPLGGSEERERRRLQGHPSPGAAVVPGILPCIPLCTFPCSFGIKESGLCHIIVGVSVEEWLSYVHSLRSFCVSLPARSGTLTPHPQPTVLWVPATVEDWRLPEVVAMDPVHAGVMQLH